MPEPTPTTRLSSIDTLRGLVIVLMILDHARDYLGPTAALPEDLGARNSPLFFTRWVTHLCAPVFVFLAGASASLRADRESHDRMRTAPFLVLRGLWLILLELTVVFVGWTFALPFWNQAGFFSNVILLQVIWVLGLSMIALAPFTRWPRWVALVCGLVIVGGHNLFDASALEEAIHWGRFTSFEWQEKLWTLAHVGPMAFLVGDVTVFSVYPVVPWIGVILLGYATGPLFRHERSARRRRFLELGLACTTLFLIARSTVSFGAHRPFTSEGTSWDRIVSFLNTEKYPPSLHYVLMTFALLFLLLAVFDRDRERPSLLWIFGRVPLFLYVVHIPLVNLLGALYFQLRFGIDRWQMGLLLEAPEYEFSLWPIYLGWILVIAILYVPARAYGRAKHRSRHPAFQWL